MNYYENISSTTRFLNLIRRMFTNKMVEPVLCFSMRKLPFLRGFIGKFIPPEYLYKKPAYRDYNVNGIRMKLDISNLVDHFIYFSFSHKAIHNFADQLKVNDTVVDIGGNIGYTTILFAKKCGEGAVISIEPSKELFKTLNEHIRLNSLTNVKVLNIGLGDIGRSAQLFKVDKFNNGRNRILETAGKDVPSETITIKTLDEVVDCMNLKEISAIKLDVEGYEYKVLQGSVKTLKNMQPVMLIEVDDANLKQQQAGSKMVFSFLHELNYTGYDAETMCEVDLTGDSAKPHFDLLCFPKAMKR